MAPIKSLSSSLSAMLDREPPPADWRDDMRNGLSVIGSRSESLIRFVGAYTQLAKLPAPAFAPVSVREWVRRVAALETRMKIDIEPGAELTVQGDAGQLEQLLINLVRNGVEAASETGGGVAVGWSRNHESVEIFVRDSGLGLSSQANLFVPFFTTKPGGSGIGLVLSRKIAENHGGSVTLQNRSDRTGCEARLRLPMNPRAAQRA
jgi:signal transduction histidine kinase